MYTPGIWWTFKNARLACSPQCSHWTNKEGLLLSLQFTSDCQPPMSVFCPGWCEALTSCSCRVDLDLQINQQTLLLDCERQPECPEKKTCTCFVCFNFRELKFPKKGENRKKQNLLNRKAWVLLELLWWSL